MVGVTGFEMIAFDAHREAEQLQQLLQIAKCDIAVAPAAQDGYQ